MYNIKTILLDIQNNQGFCNLDNPYLDLDYSGYHKNLIQ